MLFCLLFNNWLCAARLIQIYILCKSEGFALITSTLPSSVYRQRAIENALQNIALNQEQSVSSFTVVENGQMLIDQIQSRSSTGILSYTVSDEKN